MGTWKGASGCVHGQHASIESTVAKYLVDKEALHWAGRRSRGNAIASMKMGVNLAI